MICLAKRREICPLKVLAERQSASPSQCRLRCSPSIAYSFRLSRLSNLRVILQELISLRAVRAASALIVRQPRRNISFDFGKPSFQMALLVRLSTSWVSGPY